MQKSVPDDAGRQTGEAPALARPRSSAGNGQEAARRSGRRPGESGTRAAILAAARRQFAEIGYDRTSMRSIAAEAEVDQRLVAYFFGSKPQLFVASVEMPYDPAATISRLFAGDLETLGAELASLMVGMLEDPGARERIVGLVRAAAAEPAAAHLLQQMRERTFQAFGGPIVDALGPEEAELRVALIHLQFDGLVMTRYANGAEPLASLPPDQLIATLAPLLQQCVNGPIARS
jgi:AcrR family transcriptional regulator